MRLYLDASVLVALLINDAHSERADALLRAHEPIVVVSDYACAEFASAVGRRARLGSLTQSEAGAAFATLDTWVARVAERVATRDADIIAAGALLRRLELGLRVAEAINVAIAQRVTADLATFDVSMARAAVALGSVVAACA